MKNHISSTGQVPVTTKYLDSTHYWSASITGARLIHSFKLLQPPQNHRQWATKKGMFLWVSAIHSLRCELPPSIPHSSFLPCLTVLAMMHIGGAIKTLIWHIGIQSVTISHQLTLRKSPGSVVYWPFSKYVLRTDTALSPAWHSPGFPSLFITPLQLGVSPGSPLLCLNCVTNEQVIVCWQRTKNKQFGRVERTLWAHIKSPAYHEWQ